MAYVKTGRPRGRIKGQKNKGPYEGKVKPEFVSPNDAVKKSGAIAQDKKREVSVHWEPQRGPQTEVLARVEFEILYGGARGGGKTASGIAWLTEYVDYSVYRALVIRKNAEDLSDWLDRAMRLFEPLGAKQIGRPATIEFPSGAKIRTGHLKDADAYTKYLGHEYHKILIEELTLIPNEKLYLQLISACRTTNPELKPQVFSTTNPGGAGHLWVKKRFIDPYPSGYRTLMDMDGNTRVYIPAKLDDNPILMKADPQYVKKLDALKRIDPNLYEAWRNGRWDVFSGQFFRQWDPAKHVIASQVLPRELKRVVWLDYGYSPAYAAVLWVAVGYDRQLIVYRELYVQRRTHYELGREIAEKTPETERPFVKHLVYDPQLHKKESETGASGIESITRGMKSRGMKIGYVPGTRNRKYGWGIVRDYLAERVRPDGSVKPGIVFMENCANAIRVIPNQVHDFNGADPEDLDDSLALEPDIPDAVRYGCVDMQLSATRKGSGDAMKSPTEKAFKKRMKEIQWRQRGRIARRPFTRVPT